MKRILVTYATFAGSTVEGARVVGEELTRKGFRVDLLPIQEVKTLAGYDSVVIGAPMIMGWHRAALGFLKKQRKALEHLPFAVFVMAMSLTRTGETDVDGVQVTVDETLPKPPVTQGHLTFRERYARVSNYIRPILAATRPAKPKSVALFGGRLEYGRLKWWAVLFVMVIIRAPAGDRRNWTAIREWAATLPDAFGFEPAQISAPAIAVRDSASLNRNL